MFCFCVATIVVGVVVWPVWKQALQLPLAQFSATSTVGFVVVVVAEVAVEVVATVVECVVAAGAVAVPEVLFVVVAVVVTLVLVAEVAEADALGTKLRMMPSAPSTRRPHCCLKALTLVVPGNGFVRGVPHHPAPPHQPFVQIPGEQVCRFVNLKAECTR